MPQQTYRVVQWVTGHIGTIGIRHLADNSTYDLVGLYVTNPEKVGKDAREIAGTAPTGVIATNDVHEILALDADCVFYTPRYGEVDVIAGGPATLDAPWDWGTTRYRIVIDGDPPTELTLQGVKKPEGTIAHPGYDWTAMGAVNAIPGVCDSAPGWVTNLDLGLIRPRGLVRPDR